MHEFACGHTFILDVHSTTLYTDTQHLSHSATTKRNVFRLFVFCLFVSCFNRLNWSKYEICNPAEEKIENWLATMSNRYLLHQMVFDNNRFFQRLRRLYDGWKVIIKWWRQLGRISKHDNLFHFGILQNPDSENNAWSNVDCMMVAVGDDYGSVNSKSASLHVSPILVFHSKKNVLFCGYVFQWDMEILLLLHFFPTDLAIWIRIEWYRLCVHP